MFNERGFTLVETVTAMLIFSLLLVTALPVAIEANHHLVSGVRRMAAMGIAESKMEELQKNTSSLPRNQRKTTKEGRVSYDIRWRREFIARKLSGCEVTVEWRDSWGNERSITLKSLNYRP
ncbi:type IV pilus modification PilV family protein [Marininema halotolerans]|uniref:Prepilin-type N-terminal cleavage/methylation domain-containing protein n=1 Tax=Marininema halotolerans TaxID=1155944 RepID=A0A1I6ST81_9BACL|nr:prepilin-type N-terminal cleavage/methylation domain-containing protein [Marininema halotolerans]SFS80078.1 prepilin-type N-terminal cleavage/methylation domain-containing protein [Marininema halotolerans]